MVLCSLTSSFKLVPSMLVSSTEQRLKVHKEQRLARRPNSSGSGFPTTTQFFTFLLKVILNLQRILSGLTFRKVDAGKFGFKVWHFCICQPTETGASSAGTLHWPSWRHTSSCSLRKARADTAIFSHQIHSQTTPGDSYRSDPLLPQSRRRFHSSTRAPEQSSALPSLP